MERRDAATYLLLDSDGDGEGAAIAGYYCLSAAEVAREAVPSAMGRAAPPAIPAIRMGRFAIATSYQGRGLGGDLLREALLGAVTAGRLIGARVMLVDAISDDAQRFYERFGFQQSPIHSMQVVYDLRVIAASAGVT
jgi:GNAT superfamily N-acetyltransferase